MINLYNLVPTIYSDASRDFQYLSWLINIVLNSVKHNVDDIYDLPNSDADSKLVELLAFTLGFKIRRNYNKDQLLALVNIIPSLLRYKGTKKAIELAGNALIKSSGAIGNCIVEDSEENLKNGIINVILPKDLVDSTLFIDLLPYILPAGMSCRIIRKTLEPRKATTNIGYQNVVLAKWQKDVELAEPNKVITGVSGLYDAGAPDKQPIFTNFVNYKKELNAGLLNNTVIPVINTNEILLDFEPKEPDENS